jgi:beta-galactosidase/beta-glucuronidase
MTQWGKQISPDKPVLPEYPRPQLVREQWLNLNGLWDYAITAKDAGEPAAWNDGKILVPFPIESVLSQVGKRVDETSRLWYHRTFQIPAGWAGQRVLLHFGAVDWETTVCVNGKTIGTHRGGYDGFDLDITDGLKPDGFQDLTVSVWDPTAGGQPRGKQARNPGGIFYTPTTGIWQTVWLEPVPQGHIESLKILPDLDARQLKLTVTVARNSVASSSQSVEAIVSAAGKEIIRASGKPGELLVLAIPNPQLWWPASPFLYDLTVTLKENQKSIDSVGSYFGMRKISIGPDEKGITRILLNNQFVFENGLLDQGFWPDGLYTAPTDDALRYDIEVTKKLGFNMIRKHIKVEPDRWYYWTDKLGILVWQDMPASVEMGLGEKKGRIDDMEGQYELELRRMIEGRFNHPSIILWLTFNEGWGLSFRKKTHPGDKDSPSDQSIARQRGMVAAAREEDSSRLIDAESGTGGGKGANPENFWDIGLGDLVDFHCYGGKEPPKSPEKHRAAVIGEYGYGVSPASSVASHITPKSLELGLSALVLTQLTDVEHETNGILNYDRTPKQKSPIERIGREVLTELHEAGYTNYPGGQGLPSP